MPTYVYRREDGTTFETQQRITEDPLKECPETGQSVERVITDSSGIITDSPSETKDEGAGRPQSPSCSGPLCGL